MGTYWSEEVLSSKNTPCQSLLMASLNSYTTSTPSAPSFIPFNTVFQSTNPTHILGLHSQQNQQFIHKLFKINSILNYTE